MTAVIYHSSIFVIWQAKQIANISVWNLSDIIMTEGMISCFMLIKSVAFPTNLSTPLAFSQNVVVSSSNISINWKCIIRQNYAFYILYLFKHFTLLNNTLFCLPVLDKSRGFPLTMIYSPTPTNPQSWFLDDHVTKTEEMVL